MGEKITRRDFLAKSGLLAGAAAFSGNVLNAKDNPAREGKTAGIPEVYGPWLKFRPDGTFKIVQFTDTHYIKGHRGSPRMLKLLPFILDKEKPDLAVLTGDIVFAEPAAEALKDVLSIFEEKGVPFAYIFGNHDHEYDALQEELYDTALTFKQNVMSPVRSAGKMDYAVSIHSHDGKDLAAVLYCLQYYGGTPQDVKLKDQYLYFEKNPYRRWRGYACMTREQVNWYSATAKGISRTLGHNIPALAFFHVPLSEYRYAADDSHTPFKGTRREAIYASEANGGMFTAMRENGDVMATFAGHDHDNDFAVLYHDILLAYGRMSGADTVYNHLPIGARIINLKEGKREFDSWILDYEGTVSDKWTYPASFVDGPGNPDWR